MLQPLTSPELHNIPLITPDMDVMDNLFVEKHIEKMKSYEMPSRREGETMLMMPTISDRTRLGFYGGAQ